jgi:hypothetical protein
MNQKTQEEKRRGIEKAKKEIETKIEIKYRA